MLAAFPVSLAGWLSVVRYDNGCGRARGYEIVGTRALTCRRKISSTSTYLQDTEQLSNRCIAISHVQNIGAAAMLKSLLYLCTFPISYRLASVRGPILSAVLSHAQTRPDPI
jgi:hypothetical protein